MSTRASSGRAQMTSAMSVVSGAGAATLAAFALAPVGTIAVLGIGAICAGLLVVRREMDLLHPVLRGTTETLIRLRTTMRRRNTVPQLVLRAAVPLAVLLSGAAGYLLGAQGLVALAGLTALLLMAVGASVARPLLQELLAICQTCGSWLFA